MSSASSGSLVSVSIEYLNLGFAFRWPMLRIDPVDRLSMTSTSWPAASRASARCDPMKPAPPVINALTTPVPFLRHCRQTRESLQPPDPPLSSKARDEAAATGLDLPPPRPPAIGRPPL